MLWRCLACTTRYAASLAVCPHCRSVEREEDGVMPKISVEGGPSYAGHVDVSSPDAVAPEWHVVVPPHNEEIVVQEAPAPVVEAERPARRKGKG